MGTVSIVLDRLNGALDPVVVGGHSIYKTFGLVNTRWRVSATVGAYASQGEHIVC